MEPKELRFTIEVDMDKTESSTDEIISMIEELAKQERFFIKALEIRFAKPHTNE